MVKKHRIKVHNVAIVALVVVLIAVIGYAIVNIDRFVPTAVTDDIVARVNGDPLYASDMERRLTYFQANFGPDVTPEFVLNQSINELLLLQEAHKQGITVDEASINKSVEDWFSQVTEQIGEDALRQNLALYNLTVEQYLNDTKEIYRKDFIVLTLLNNTIFSTIDESTYMNYTVTEREALDYYNASRELYNRVDASHILVCYEGTDRCQSNRTKVEARALINRIYDELKDGADFADLAKNYSDDSYSGVEGGELGDFSKDQMVKEFADVAFSLKYPNQLSEPVETQYGFHIIKLNRKLSEFADFKNEIMVQLQAQKQMEAYQAIRTVQKELLDEYVAELRKNSDIQIIVNPGLSTGISPEPGIQTFSVKEGEVCTENGKPIVRMYSTTWCPHCSWIKDTFDATMKEYVDKGLIVARHWEVDTEDDTLTSFKEDFMPLPEKEVFQQFNSKGTVPTFVLGCKYYRIGTGYEVEGDLAAEKREFVAVIEKLLTGQ